MRKPMLPVVTLACAGVLFAQPVVNAVVNGASYDGTASPGCLISIFGTNLARSTASAATVPLPTKLGDTAVTVDGVAAPLYFVSPQQINAQVPFETTKTTVAVVVTTADGKSTPYLINTLPVAPGLFTATADGRGRVLAFDGSFRPVERVEPGDVIILYATGLGVTIPAAVSGAGGSSTEPFNRVTNVPEVYIGETKADLIYAGLAPGFAGVYQLNVRVPGDLLTDRVFLRCRGWQGNIVEIGIRELEVPEAQGTIQARYPVVEMSPQSFSPLLQVADFTLRFVPAGYSVYTIAAVSDAASAIIRIQPQNVYEATITLPTAKTRQWDFSGTEITPWDFGPGCSAPSVQCGLPFPGNILPLSRLDSLALRALRGEPPFGLPELPLPNTEIPGSSVGSLKLAGLITPGAPFIIDRQNNGALAAFGGFLQIPLGPAKTRTATFKLYLNGKPIASATVNYPVWPR